MSKSNENKIFYVCLLFFALSGLLLAYVEDNYEIELSLERKEKPKKRAQVVTSTKKVVKSYPELITVEEATGKAKHLPDCVLLTKELAQDNRYCSCSTTAPEGAVCFQKISDLK